MLVKLVRGALALALACSVLGCAEIDRRGGIVDEVENKFLFPATTKSHRLLRSYVVLGALIAVARDVGIAEGDRAAIGGNLAQALGYANDAYECIYPGRPANPIKPIPPIASPPADAPYPFAHCVFFDERMTRLDYMIYKIASVVMLDPDSRTLFADVRNTLIGEIPVVSPALRAVSRANDAAHETATATQQLTTLINNILQISANGFGRAVYLFPIYRDTMELDMHIVLDTLRIQCDPSWNPALYLKRPGRGVPPRVKVVDSPSACAAYAEGNAIFNGGDGTRGGRIGPWRDFVVGLRDQLGPVEAYPLHFALVSNWFAHACGELFKTPGKTSTTPMQNFCYPLIEIGPAGPNVPSPFHSPLRNIDMMALHRTGGPQVAAPRIQPAQPGVVSAAR